MIGTEIDGRYRILAKLDEGGMGEVYLAEHMHLGRTEALKFLHPKLAGESEFAGRFRREARAMNRLSHPNIVAVYDFGRTVDGRYYLAIEYAEGRTLADVTALEGALPVARVARILAQLAEAIDHAHAHGVIHRDLKPANVVLAAHRGQLDVVKVLDFGLAKIVTPDYHDSVSSTRGGSLYGTVGYTAPELFRGDEASAASDLYALGCMGWEMLTGRAPFMGRPAEVMDAHVHRIPTSPSASRITTPVPVAIEALVMRCLDKDPRRRPRAGELVEALANASTDRIDVRRSQRRIAIPATLVAAPRPADDFADEQTSVDGVEKGPDTQLGRAATLMLPLGDALAQYRGALRQQAEALLDLGADDVRLGVALSQLGRIELELDRRAGDMDDLEQDLTTTEQRAREREASVRFAMGDLRFLRDQAVARNGPVGAELDEQLGMLGAELTRLLGDRDRAVRAITERQLAIAARAAAIEDELLAHCQALDPIVDHAGAVFSSIPAVAAARVRLRGARLLIEMASSRR